MLKQEVESIDVVYLHFIQRTGKHEVRTLPLTKQYKIVYDKIQRLQARIQKIFPGGSILK